MRVLTQFICEKPLLLAADSAVIEEINLPPTSSIKFRSRLVLIALFLAAVWLQGLVLHIARPFLLPGQGEVVNGRWLFCSFPSIYVFLYRLCFYILMLLFFAAVNYRLLKRIYNSPSSFQLIFAAIAFVVVLFAAASFRYGGAPLPPSAHWDGSEWSGGAYIDGYQWKWLGVRIQKTIADCN